MSDAITPFEIKVSDAVLSDLRERLARTRFPGQIDGANWDYGTELSYLRELVAYWKDRFDWRAQERLLNSFPQFTTPIDDHRCTFRARAVAVGAGAGAWDRATRRASCRW